MSISSPDLLRQSSLELIASEETEGHTPPPFAKWIAALGESLEQPPQQETLSEEEPEEALALPLQTAIPFTPPLPLASAPVATPRISPLEPAAWVAPLFEKMASHLLVVHLPDAIQTSFVLDQPQFKDSPFFGTEIRIKEFSSAPKAFNVEIISGPVAIATLHAHEQRLLSLFAQGEFPFIIHRLETQIREEREPSSSGYDDEGADDQHEDPPS
jgi:hypothetical protein